MWNARLWEVQAGIKFAGRNINDLRYADDTNLVAEIEEELKNLLMKMKEESENAGLNLKLKQQQQQKKTKIMDSGPMPSWQIHGDTMETVTDFIYLGSHEIERHCSLEEKLWPI